MTALDGMKPLPAQVAPGPTPAVCGDRSDAGLCTRPAGHKGGHIAGNGRYWQASDGTETQS